MQRKIISEYVQGSSVLALELQQQTFICNNWKQGK
jgi:hypothetical protein